MLKCTKHPNQSYILNLTVSFQPGQEIPQVPAYCFICFSEAMIRLGVCALFPAEVIEKAEEWPTDLEEKKS